MTPEEATAAPADEEVQSQDTPQDEAASTETPAETPASDYEKRYNDLRPEFDRTNQEVAQYRQIIEAARQGDPQALDWLGLEAADANQQDEEEFVDPEEELANRIQALESQLAERDQQTEAQQMEQAEDNWLLEQVGSLETKENTQLSNEEFGLLLTHALANRLEDGQPDVQGAYTNLRKAQDGYRENYVASKRANQVPAGAAGEQKFDTSTPEGRREALAAAMDQVSPE